MTIKSSGNPASAPHLTSRFQLASPHDPNSFLRSLDVIHEMSTDKKRYQGEEWLQISNYPSLCLTNVDRIRAHCTAGSHLILSCCISHGLTQIGRYPGVKELRRLKHRYDNSPPSLSGTVKSAIHLFMSGFEVSVPNGRRRTNLRVSDTLKKTLGSASTDLSIPFNSFAVLAIMSVLAEQEHTNDDDKQEMMGYLTKFYESVDVRVKGAKSLMDTFEIPEPVEKREIGLESSDVFYD